MATEKIPIIKGDAISSGVQTDYRDALPVNMYAVVKNILGTKGYMLSYPGLTSLGTGLGVDRAANYNEQFNVQYRVSGTRFISVAADGTVINIGTAPGTEQCSMPYSFDTQAVIANGRMWLYSPAGGYNEITDTDLGNPIDGTWVQPGIYFLTDGDSLYHTELLDETSIAVGDFSTAELSPDKTLGVMTTQDSLVMVFGRYSLQYFAYTGDTDFAFQNVPNRGQQIGIVATHAKVASGGKYYITGGRKGEAVGVHTVGVGSSEKISSREVDKLLKEYTETELADIRMEARTEDDVTFITLHLPDYCLCFNDTVAKSFGREYAWTLLKSDLEGDTPYRGINGVNDSRSSKWVFGDKQDTTIGFLNNDACTHYDSIVVWLMSTPFFFLNGLSIDEIELETIPGRTGTAGAEAYLSVTYDGNTYSNEYTIAYGEPADYNNRFIARSLGDADDWIGFRFRGASASRMAFALLRMEYS